MRSLLRLIINNPIAVVLMVIFMSLAGMYSLWHMPVDLFPNLDIPVVNIITHYPGAAPEDMELLISRPIENQIRGIPSVKRVASTSVQGIAQVTAEFSWGTTVRDARQLVQARLARLAGTLPAGVAPRLENIGTTLQEVGGYVVYGGTDLVSIRNIVRYNLAGRLMAVNGVSSVEVLGGDQRAFYVAVKPEMLLRLHLSVNDIEKLLKDNNISTVTGYFDSSGREYLIRGDARLKTMDDIRQLPVNVNCTGNINKFSNANSKTQPVLLGDIARIYQGAAPRHYTVKGNTVPAVAMIIRKQPGASTVRVMAGIDKSLSSLKKLLPPGAQIKKFYDQSEIIKESQSEITSGLAIGALLVVIVLYFFLGSVRPMLVVVVTIPVTFLATLAVMGWLGMSLNVITMSALTLAIGMIVDDAIVVSENIFRHDSLTLNTQTASIEGTLEIAGADASGTFTTVAAFLPLVLMTGLAAIFMRPFGITISAALIISLLLSLTLVPTMFGRMKNLSFSNSNDIFPGAWLMIKLNTALQVVLNFAFRHKWVVLTVAVLSLSSAGLSAFLGKASVLPPIDEGALLIEYTLVPGTSLKESNRIGNMLEKIALANPNVTCVYRRTGSPAVGYQIEGVNSGELLIKLKPKNQRTQTGQQIMASLKKLYSALDGVVFLYHQPTQEKIDESFSGMPALFGVTIYGTNMTTLTALASKVETVLTKEPGLSNIINNTRIQVSQINVRINYPALARYHVAVKDVFNTLRAARLGVEATQIVRQKENIAILVRLDNQSCAYTNTDALDNKRTNTFGNTKTKLAGITEAGSIGNINQIRQLPLQNAQGDWLPLERVASVTTGYAPAFITHLNGQREITLMAEVDGNIPAIVNKLRQKFQAIKLPKGYSIGLTGQYQSLIETATEMIFAVLAAIVLIYLIMAMQFGSWGQPFIIILTIPFSLAGALWALFITGQGVDISVGMGTVTLVGIAVNNAIVLLDFANKQISSGSKVRNALLLAASVRLRPIVLTTVTTIAALLPTAIASNSSSGIFQPFAITVIGGLLSGLLATLIIIPTIADIMHLRTFSGKYNTRRPKGTV